MANDFSWVFLFSFIISINFLMIIWAYKLFIRKEYTQVTANVLGLTIIWTSFTIRCLNNFYYFPEKPILLKQTTLDSVIYNLAQSPFYIAGLLILLVIQNLLADGSNCGRGVIWLCRTGLISFGIWFILAVTGNGFLI